MKNFIIAALMLLSFCAYATDWNEMAIGEVYTLKNDIVFADGAALKKGESFELVDFYPLSVPVVYLNFKSPDCVMPEATGELTIVNPSPEETDTDRSVGVSLDRECSLNLFVELKDIYSKSLFE